MTTLIEWVLALWVLPIAAAAVHFHRKQNSSKAWTGGPISWPKAYWLAFTLSTWFFFPLVALAHPSFPEAFRYAMIFHLASWWLRGILEGIMIYRWKNWTPNYGISHDAFHVIGFAALCYSGSAMWGELDRFGIFIASFSVLIVYSTVIEGVFAYLFKATRTKEEEEENVYFASDDPKWRLINRITLTSVIVCLTHLGAQGFWLLFTQ
ncbi:MAG: hypothetical protein V4760_12120 [Bdellovibrionota bacterium]